MGRILITAGGVYKAAHACVAKLKYFNFNAFLKLPIIMMMALGALTQTLFSSDHHIVLPCVCNLSQGADILPTTQGGSLGVPTSRSLQLLPSNFFLIV